MSTSGGRKPSYNNVKGSNIRHSKTDACTTTNKPPKKKLKIRQILHSFRPHEVQTYLTTDNDHIVGGIVKDKLIGGSGNDNLVGNNGDDIMNGGDGADTMEGGSGSDIYEVNHAGDKVIEVNTIGVDTVYAARMS